MFSYTITHTHTHTHHCSWCSLGISIVIIQKRLNADHWNVLFFYSHIYSTISWTYERWTYTMKAYNSNPQLNSINVCEMLQIMNKWFEYALNRFHHFNDEHVNAKYSVDGVQIILCVIDYSIAYEMTQIICCFEFRWRQLTHWINTMYTFSFVHPKTNSNGITHSYSKISWIAFIRFWRFENM